nr:hypothetical protein [Clostridia bacterium]
MNTGTRLRTALVIASSLNTALMATDLTGFHNQNVDEWYTIVSLVLNFIIVALATYFNNDYTEIAAQYTGEMRQEKAEQTEEYEGEVFYDDAALEEEDPEEDEDEE